MNQFDRRSLLTAGAVILTAGASASAQKPPTQSIRGEIPLKNTKTHFAANLEMWWGNLPFTDRIREAKACGFTAFEFWPWRGKDLDAIAVAMKETGMVCSQFTAWGFVPGMNDAKNHDHFEQEIKDSIVAAKKLGVKLMCVVAGNDIAGVSQEAMHDTVIVALKRVAKIAEDNDVKLLLEPMNIRVDHKGHCLYGSAPAIKIVRAVGSTHVKILWDLYHMHITEGDLCGHLKEGIKELAYVQIADHPGRNEPGTGEIHYNRVLNELSNLDYSGYVGVECTPSIPELDATRAVAFADIW